jgi:uncharacterized protein
VKLTARTALAISLGAIVLHWVYQLVSQRHGPDIPATFTALVLQIVAAKVVTFAAIVLLLRLQGERLAQLGLTRDHWPRHVGLGLVIGVVMFVMLNVLLTAVLNSLIAQPASGGPGIMAFFRSPRNLLAWLPIGIFGGGVVEELERIFVLTRFEEWLGRRGLVLAVVLSSAMFGYGHLYQGVGTALSTMVSGVVFAFVYLRRRSALEPITAHAFSDVLAVFAATLLARH